MSVKNSLRLNHRLCHFYSFDVNIYRVKVPFLSIREALLSYFYVRMNAGKSNQELITSLQNGQEETLFYLNKKYFQTSRRWLRRKGVPDSSTPQVFSKVLVRIYRLIQHKRILPTVEFEPFLFNTMSDFLENSGEDFRRKKNQSISESSDRDKTIVASCFGILDENFRNLLSARYVSKMSYEEIAARFEFGNPVIAQFEVEKALNQFRTIAIARLNPTVN